MRVWVERNRRATGATYSTVWQDDAGRRSRRTFKARHEALDLRDSILAGELPPPPLTTHTAPEGGPAGRPGLTVPTPWVDFIASFWSMCAQENRPSTIKRYRTIVRNFERDCGPQTVPYECINRTA